MIPVRITPLNSMGKNSRGEGFSISSPRETKNYMFVKRNKGTISGNHFHHGLVPEKDPEIVFLLEGTLNLITKDLDNDLEASYLIEAPAMIEIFPKVVHVFEAVTDISFLECNSLDEHKQDTESYTLFTREKSPIS